jgi:5-methylcytosine-specific restriction endonuclease McrA
MSELDAPVLVLNKAWQSIDAYRAQKALSAVMSERARFVHPQHFTLHDINSWMELDLVDGEAFIQSVRQRIKTPEVIVLNKYDKIPKRVVIFSRRNLWKRDKYRCQYCGKRPKNDEISIDHILPKSRGGVSSFENCVLSCMECNMQKNHRLPEEAHMRLFRCAKNRQGEVEKHFYTRPKRPVWSPLYAIPRNTIPASWANFLHQKIDELYWDSELDP